MVTGTCGETAPGGAPLLQCFQLTGTCGGCIASNTCDLFTYACAPNADCVCMAQCIGTASLSGTNGCLGTCGLTGSPPGFYELAKVLATMCPDSDECSAPPGYVPPPPIAPPPTSSAGIGGGDLADCGLNAGLPYNPTGNILQLRSADGSICVRIDRRNNGPGALANTSWTLLDMTVGPLGQVCHTADPSSLCWHSSHHNFDDWAHAWCGSRHYDVNVAMAGHGLPPTYQLHVFEAGPLGGGSCPPTADGVCRIGQPIDLFPFP